MVFWIMELSKLNPNPNRYPKISKNQIPKKNIYTKSELNHK